jgi:hypothetical protein
MSPKEYLISQLPLYFVEYSKGKEVRKFYHMEEEFHVGIFTENNEQSIYQLNSDHEAQGISFENWNELEVRFKSFTGADICFLSERTRQFYDEMEKENNNK